MAFIWHYSLAMPAIMSSSNIFAYIYISVFLIRFKMTPCYFFIKMCIVIYLLYEHYLVKGKETVGFFDCLVKSNISQCAINIILFDKKYISLYMIWEMYNILSLLWKGKIQTTEYQETGNKFHEHSLISIYIVDNWKIQHFFWNY